MKSKLAGANGACRRSDLTTRTDGSRRCCGRRPRPPRSSRRPATRVSGQEAGVAALAAAGRRGPHGRPVRQGRGRGSRPRRSPRPRRGSRRRCSIRIEAGERPVRRSAVHWAVRTVEVAVPHREGVTGGTGEGRGATGLDDRSQCLPALRTAQPPDNCLCCHARLPPCPRAPSLPRPYLSPAQLSACTSASGELGPP